MSHDGSVVVGISRAAERGEAGIYFTDPGDRAFRSAQARTASVSGRSFRRRWTTAWTGTPRAPSARFTSISTVEVIPGRTPGSDGHWAAERILAALGMSPVPVLVHGEQQWAWPVLRWAQAAGYDVRIGLEDTRFHLDGREARDNADLVEAALKSEPGTPSQWPVPDPL